MFDFARSTGNSPYVSLKIAAYEQALGNQIFFFLQMSEYTNTFLIHSDTVSRSGMYCALATTIERCKTEGVVDVFQVVKALRVQKPGGVLTVVSVYWISVGS